VKVSISGHADLASELEAALRHGQVPTGKFLPTHKLVVEESPGTNVIVDSVAGKLERVIVHWIASLLDHHKAGAHVELHRQGGIRDDDACRLLIPSDEKVRRLAMLGIVSAMQNLRDGKLL
jgi:hypothetical protein